MTIKGVPITLYERIQDGVDDFNRPVFAEKPVVIDNVVIGHPTTDDITSEINLSGKTVAYMLAIPADDNHSWENCTVEFYGQKWSTIGIPRQYMDGFMGATFPWNKLIGVERFE